MHHKSERKKGAEGVLFPSDVCYCFSKQVIDKNASYNFFLYMCPMLCVSKREHQNLKTI